MTDDKEYLSKEKYEELQKELDYLKHTRRKEIAEHLEFAKSLGDLSENAEYHEARQDQAEIEDRIVQLESLLQSAEIAPRTKGDVVAVGSTVVVKREGEKENRSYIIVGAEESNTAEGKISYKSPIGEALMGKTKGAVAVYKTPSGETKCTVVDIK